ncbi:MAG: hypothetical protein QXF76_04920 [Candidatus Anstonellales archaeon]
MMKRKLILCLNFLPIFLFAQYYNERSTEQNFETSDFYFNRYSFNPYGMYNFKEVTPGLIDNPFLNIFLNPAKITETKDRFNFYIDYRGERTTYHSEFYPYPIPLAGFDEPSIDLRYPYPYYITQARLEPEPKFSVGIIAAPFNSIAERFFIGATFQRIHKAESFYSMPFLIYNPVWGYDPWGNRYFVENDFNPPSEIDRNLGKDEMVTSANLFSIFSGYKLNDKFSLGLQISGINHLREGGYQRKYNDDFGNIDNRIYLSDYSINRGRDYKQVEYTIGMSYSEGVSKFGIKFGLLNGDVNQSLENINSFFYQENQPDISSSWGYSLNNNKTIQNWNNSGNLYFGGFDIFHQLNDDIQIVGYFSYTNGDINFRNSSFIKDTSNYYSKYDYQLNNQDYWNKSKSFYSLIDNRTGSGVKKKSDYSGLIALRWKLSPKIKISFGLAYFEQNLDINSKEPVILEIISQYEYNTNNPNNSNRNVYFRTFEDKNLDWNYSSINFSYQLPVVLDFKLGEKVEASILINQISGGTKVNEYTKAYIKKRIRTENDSTNQVNDFVEKYISPTVNKTYERTDLIGKIRFNLHPNLNFNFLIDPELSPFLNIAQWWFSIEGRF